MLAVLNTRSSPYIVTDVDWNDVIGNLNNLTAGLFVLSGRVGVGTASASRQLHVYGLGQTTGALTDAGNKNGTLYLQDSGGSVGNGGAIVLGSLQGHFGAVKSLLTDGSNNTLGDMAFSMRKVSTDTALTEYFRLRFDGSLRLSNTTVHGFTDLAPANSYSIMGPVDATAGGLAIYGFAGGVATGLLINGYTGNVDATKSTTGVGAITIRGGFTSAATVGSMTANSNILVVRDYLTTRFILDSDGDSHQDLGSSWTNFDDYDDVSLLTAISAAVSRDGDPLRHQFASVLSENKEAMERARIVTFNDDGHNFVNWSRMNMLLVGAVRQLGARLQAAELDIAALRQPRLESVSNEVS